MTATDGVYKADLPYFGRAYQASFGGDGGIEFDGEPGELDITRNEKKRTITVSFQIDGNNDHYKVSLTTGYSGYGNLHINCRNKQAISYYGQVSAIEEP